MKNKEVFLILLRYIIFIFGIYFLIGGILGLIYNAFALTGILLNQKIDLPKVNSLPNVLIFILFGLIFIKCGQGLKLKKKWGWKSALIILFSIMLSSLYGIYKNIFFMGSPFNWLLLNSLTVVITPLFIIYLFQKSIRQLFN